MLARTPPTGAKSKSRIPMSHTNRQLDMEDPLSPQPDPNPISVPANPSPRLHAVPWSHLPSADRQHAHQSRLQTDRQLVDGQLGDSREAERQAADQASPSGWGMQAAAPRVGGFRLARTPIGKPAGLDCLPQVDATFESISSCCKAISMCIMYILAVCNVHSYICFCCCMIVTVSSNCQCFLGQVI